MSQSRQGSLESIDDVLGEDHADLGEALGRLHRAILARDAEATQCLEEFSVRLVKHMTWEEEDLFPAVAQRATASERRSIESLVIDHERIRETLDALRSSLSIPDFGTSGTLANWLDTLLQGHNYDEEHGVYVQADRLLDKAERLRILGRFRGT